MAVYFAEARFMIDVEDERQARRLFGKLLCKGDPAIFGCEVTAIGKLEKKPSVEENAA